MRAANREIGVPGIFSCSQSRDRPVSPNRLRKNCPTFFFIPSEARNLSFFFRAQDQERFLGPLGMTKKD
jgi:hypothetical protein